MASASLVELPELLAGTEAASVFVFRGRESYDRAGFREKFEAGLRGYAVRSYSDSAPNPTVEDIERALAVFSAVDPEVVIAVGGGSVMDTAKLVRFFAHQTCGVREYFLGAAPGPVASPRSKLICIPTTSGTGSESTQFATLYIDRRKFSLDLPCCLPDYKILDGLFVSSLPREIAMTTGLDALSHALESLWSLRATPQSRRKSLEALRLILANLEARLERPDPHNAYHMLVAASLAGEAIQVSRTTTSHAISYPLTSIYRLPHGRAVAMTLKQLLKFNEEAIPDSTKAEACASLGLAHFSELHDVIAGLFERLRVKTRLADYGLDTDSAMRVISEYVSVERLSNNPRKVTEQDVRNFLNGEALVNQAAARG